MHKTLQTWVDELSEEIVLDHSTAVGKQGIANMVTIGVGGESLKSWGKESVKEFILACRDLMNHKSNGQSMLFYCWYDEQAGQIRFSAIASEHNNPPFQCELQYVELDVLVDNIFKHTSGLDAEGGSLYLWTSTIS